MQDWFRANKLTLNINKTVCMSFGKDNTTDPKIRLGNDILPVVKKTKCLGILIDSHLNWNFYYDHVVLKISRNQHLMRNCKNLFNMATKKNIYYAHVYSHLVYSCTVWGNMLNKGKLQKLQVLQNKCVSYLTNKK